MAKAISGVRKQNRINVENLAQRDQDILNLETKAVMKKYKLEKQGVYDRRFALNKKLKAAGLTLEQAVSNNVKTEIPAKKEKLKKAQPRKYNRKKAEPEKAVTAAEEKLSDSREMMVVSKQVPVIMKPIEINFENFSIRLNGVPKKISVNPDTNAIEIDL